MLAGRAGPGRAPTRRRVLAVALLGGVLGGAAGLWHVGRGGEGSPDHVPPSGVLRVGDAVEAPYAMVAPGGSVGGGGPMSAAARAHVSGARVRVTTLPHAAGRVVA